MGYERAEWHSGLTYHQECGECNTPVDYDDYKLGFRPWFPDGFVYCPKCRKPLRHNEDYAINAPKAPEPAPVAPAVEAPVWAQPAPASQPASIWGDPAPAPQPPVWEQPAPVPQTPVWEQPAPVPQTPVWEQPAPVPQTPVWEQPADETICLNPDEADFAPQPAAPIAPAPVWQQPAPQSAAPAMPEAEEEEIPRFCSICGKAFRDDDIFCSRCGTKRIR